MDLVLTALWFEVVEVETQKTMIFPPAGGDVVGALGVRRGFARGQVEPGPLASCLLQSLPCPPSG